LCAFSRIWKLDVLKNTWKHKRTVLINENWSSVGQRGTTEGYKGRIRLKYIVFNYEIIRKILVCIINFKKNQEKSTIQESTL
jgi:hypothetical protein